MNYDNYHALIRAKLVEASQKEYEAQLHRDSAAAKKKALAKAKTVAQQFAGKSYGIVKGVGKMTKEQHKKYFAHLHYTPVHEVVDDQVADVVELSEGVAKQTDILPNISYPEDHPAKSKKKQPLKTHKSGCAYNYGHDCNCGGSKTHASNCEHNYGHDCDCGLKEETVNEMFADQGSGSTEKENKEWAKKFALSKQNLHRVSVTVSDPNATAVTQRKAQIQKTVKIRGNDSKHAVQRAKQFYKTKGYKVHDANHIEELKEATEDRLDTACARLKQYDPADQVDDKACKAHLMSKHGHSEKVSDQAIADRTRMRALTSSPAFKANASMHSEEVELVETSQKELIKQHNALRKELEKKVSDSMSAWHASQRELKAHLETHPNYKAMKDKKDAKDNAQPYFEPGRDREPSKGPGYY